jgi:hypothetical protein
MQSGPKTGELMCALDILGATGLINYLERQIKLASISNQSYSPRGIETYATVLKIIRDETSSAFLRVEK